jgi:GT2 family glycosyltransferase
MQYDLVLVAVHYKSIKDTLNFLDSISKLLGQENILVVVVDNSIEESPKNFEDTLVQVHKNTAYLPLPNNAGYMGAANEGLTYCKKKHITSIWTAICNIDLVFEDIEFLNKLNKISSRDNRVGMIAPSLIATLTGLSQNPYMIQRPSVRKLKRNQWIFSHYTIGRAYHLLSYLKNMIEKQLPQRITIENSSSTIYAPHGAFMLFHQRYFELGGNWQFEPFLYCEEIFVGETCRKLGLLIVYEPSLSIIHNEHVSTGGHFMKSRIIMQYVADSLDYCIKKFFTPQLTS